MNRYNYFIKFLKGKLTTLYSGITAKMNYIITIGHLRIRLISVEKVFPNPNWYCREHSHIYYEFHIITGGKGSITIEGETFPVRGGYFYITGPGVKHIQISDEKDPMIEYCIKLDLQMIDSYVMDDIDNKQESLDIIKSLSSVYKYPFRDIYDIQSMVDEMFKVVESRQPGYTFIFRIKAMEIVNSFYRTLCDKTTHINSWNLKNYESYEERIDRIIMFISKNYMNNISIGDLEQNMSLSGKQINRILLKKFNKTFHDYLNQYRLIMVKQLAEETSLTTEQIAFQCGFSNVRSLYQALKKYAYPTPLQIRKDPN